MSGARQLDGRRIELGFRGGIGGSHRLQVTRDDLVYIAGQHVPHAVTFTLKLSTCIKKKKYLLFTNRLNNAMLLISVLIFRAIRKKQEGEEVNMVALFYNHLLTCIFFITEV